VNDRAYDAGFATTARSHLGVVSRRSTIIASQLIWSTWRSVYRFWHYAIGALSAGLIADRLGIGAAIIAIGRETFPSGLIVAVAMRARDPL
jgi:hypothetical protein